MLCSPDQAVAVAPGDDTDVAVVVDVRALEVQPTRGIDAALELAVVGGTTAITDTRPVDWGAAVTAGQRAIAHELDRRGSCTMLELARCPTRSSGCSSGGPVAHVPGRPGTGWRTLLVAIETARRRSWTAAWIDPAGGHRGHGQGPRRAVPCAPPRAHCQQVLAGIGFTTEHDLHLSVRRVLVLDQLLGSSKTLTAELGMQLLAMSAATVAALVTRAFGLVAIATVG